MPKYIVQVRQRGVAGERSYWEDVIPPGGGWGGGKPSTWEAAGPQDAFAAAVAVGQEAPFADDGVRSLVEGEYRVLPFGGGATFRVGLNVDETVHESQREAVAHGR